MASLGALCSISPNNDFGEFYADGKNYMFIRETMAEPFLSIFIARGREKEQEKKDKSEVLPSGVWDFYNNHLGIPMMRSIMFILGCYLVLILRKSKWNKLTGHLKNSEKNWPNSRSNSLQPGENDADQLSNNRRLSGRLLILSRPIALHFMFKGRGYRTAISLVWTGAIGLN